MKNSSQNVNKPDPTMHKNNYIPLPSQVYSKDERLVQHLKIYEHNPQYEQVKEEKSYDHII